MCLGGGSGGGGCCGRRLVRCKTTKVLVKNLLVWLDVELFHQLGKVALISCLKGEDGRLNHLEIRFLDLHRCIVEMVLTATEQAVFTVEKHGPLFTAVIVALVNEDVLVETLSSEDLSHLFHLLLVDELLKLLLAYRVLCLNEFLCLLPLDSHW